MSAVRGNIDLVERSRGMQQRASPSHDVFDVESSAPQSGKTPVPLALSSNRESSMPGESTPPYLDKHWATAFKINVLITVTSAVYFSISAIPAFFQFLEYIPSIGPRHLLGSKMSPADAEQTVAHGHSEGSISPLSFIMGAVVVAAALLIPYGMLACFLHRSRAVVFATPWLVAFVAVISFGASLSMDYFISAIVAALVLALAVRAMRKGEHRLEFSAANLKVAAMAIKTMPSARWFVFAMIGLQFLWTSMVFVAGLGSLRNIVTVTGSDGTSFVALSCSTIRQSKCWCNGNIVSEESCSYEGIPRFTLLAVFWLVSFLWGSNVIKNIVAATVSGAVASWWFTPGDLSPIGGSFYRAIHSSLGSLCKAGALENVMAIFSMLLRLLLFFVPCSMLFVILANWCMENLVTYVVCFIAVYGSNFNVAAQQARTLFQSRTMTIVANDLIADLGLLWITLLGLLFFWLANICTSIFIFVKASGSDMKVGLSVQIVAMIVLGGIACYLMIVTLLEVLRAGFKVVFVCFVQHSDTLIERHGTDVHHGLTTAWTNLEREMNRTRSVAGTPAHNPVTGV